MTADPVIEWLLEGDPAVRWQVMRDLLDEPLEHPAGAADTADYTGVIARYAPLRASLVSLPRSRITSR